MNIVRASLKHAELLSVLGRQTFDDTFRGTCSDEDLEGVLEEFYNLPQVEKELSNPKDMFHIYFDDETAAGYSRMKADEEKPASIFSPNSIELKRIYFLPEFHGKGMASQLLEYVMGEAKALGHDQIYLSVWEHNHRGMGFYKKHGFINSEVENPFPLGETPQMDYWFCKEL